MVLMTCPWCDEERPVAFDELVAEFHCESCGTTTDVAGGAPDAERELDLAA